MNSGPRVGGALGLVAAGGLALAHLAGVLGLTAAIRVGVAVLGVIALAVVVHGLLATGDGASGDDGWVKEPRRARAGRPGFGEVGGLERAMRFGESSAMDFHMVLRPRISAVATRRLVEAGIDPADPTAVESVLGPLGAFVVDPDAKAPADRQGPGVPAAAVRDVLSKLNALK
ncbi:MAG: hypothetical protein ACYCSF_05525 [Acidimicrobiales bacterium]